MKKVWQKLLSALLIACFLIPAPVALMEAEPPVETAQAIADMTQMEAEAQSRAAAQENEALAPNAIEPEAPIEPPVEETVVELGAQAPENESQPLPAQDQAPNEENTSQEATMAGSGVAIDETNFPDPNFRAYVMENCDKDGDGVLSDAEIEAVEEINVDGLNKTYKDQIADLNGVQFFRGLKRLVCRLNKIIKLDVSMLTELEYLDCDNNQLTVLGISNNKNLTTLICYSNKLTQLDVSQNKKLHTISCDNCQLKELDVSNNNKLWNISCRSNYLSSLDVSMLSSLFTLYCQCNLLTSIDVSNNPRLNLLCCYGNSIAELDITNNPELSNAYLYGERTTHDDGYDFRDRHKDRKYVKYYTYTTIPEELELDENTKVIPGDPSADPQPSKPTPTPTPSTDTTIKLSKNTKKTINVGDSLQIKLSKGKAKSYKSSDTKIATVSKTGLVKANKAGTAKITVTKTDKTKLTLTLTVVDPKAPTGIKLNKSGTVKMKPGEKITLKATLTPATAESPLTWASSNAKVATVKAGKVTAVAEGSATITVSTSNGKTATVKITVQKNTDEAPRTIRLISAKGQTIAIGKKIKLETEIEPKGATSQLTWESSNKKIATVNSTGTVTGKSAGTCTITVTTANKLKASIDITVEDVHAPTSVKIEPDYTEPIAVGDNFQLTAVMTAIDKPESTLTWKSSDPSIVRVDKKGNILGKKEGVAFITVTTSNGLSDTIMIEVDNNAYDTVVISELDEALLQNSNSENCIIRYHSVMLSAKIYGIDKNSKPIENYLKNLGFGDFSIHHSKNKSNLFGKEHDLSYIIGYKDIKDDYGSKTRVFSIVCQGTGEKEWGSDFTLGLERNHEGFDLSAQKVKAAFDKYYQKHKDKKIEDGNYKVWVTGHSRGAAVANLLAGQYLSDLGFKDYNVFGYTFACPNVRKGTIDQKYNIFNYNLGGDAVPRVPFEAWGYGRYGRTYTEKNGTAFAGKLVIDTKTMNRFSNGLSQLSNDDINMVLEHVKEELGQKKAVSWGVAIELLLAKLLSAVVDLSGFSNEGKTKILKDTKDMGKFILLIWNTHSQYTYKTWITGLGEKSIKKWDK